MEKEVSEPSIVVQRDNREFIRFDGIGRMYAGTDPAHRLNAQFDDYVSQHPGLRVLEIGSRRRSALQNFARATTFRNVASYLGQDILPGENVDLVGDAHELSRQVGAESFDCVFSEAVFEHLLVPMKVALEANRVLVTGGTLFARTHQTIGLHDMPWDFHRFSQWAWTAYFNQQTGFEIIDAQMGDGLRLTPIIYHPAYRGHEDAIGWQSSVVWARKIGPANFDLPINVNQLIASLEKFYPD